MLARVLALAAAAVGVVVCSAACDRVPASSSATSAPQFAALVDEYLDQFARRHPSIAAGNGIHAHDGELEDFSAPAIAAEIDWLRGFRRRIDAVDPVALTPDERVDRRILQGVIDGWLLDLDTIRTWARNPMIYASAISDGVGSRPSSCSRADERLPIRCSVPARLSGTRTIRLCSASA